ncbi:SusE-like outer membrane protein [Kordia periserrulae]|uniref:SusE-like outer membrane protein n=1 Tax=Kordia periserrulae TaxID=701523 RepID=A0A2T6C1R2_9FLAO|nr:SusE domain-containing protein [Kordia periserrulae]PTX62251.1 SusE-like outer membrane protein [Kordia periserrulae]
MKKKYVQIITLFVIALVGLISCQKEENLQPEGEWTLSAPVITAPTETTSIILDETTPNETITFTWDAAESSAGYAVTYEVMIDTLGTTDFSTPILATASSNNGTETSVSITYEAINEALAYGGYPANSEATISFAVKANSLSKSSIATGDMSVTRFENEIVPTKLYISGTATENNNNLAEAIVMRRLTDTNGLNANIHEVYTSLIGGETYKFYSERSLPALVYGGSEGNLELFGDGIVAENDGQYRIRINLDTNTYELLQINYWGMVGSPVQGGWGGDEPLQYQGNGIWQASINLENTGGFVFRANGDWAYLLKRVVGTPNTLVLENDATNQGLSIEDIPNDLTGLYIVTLDLSAENYSYSFEEDNTVIYPIATPSQLFLFENGTMIYEFSKDGDVFSSNEFIPMQASNSYTLNSAMDGSGVSYSVNANLAETVNADGDRVSDDLTLFENSNTFTVSNDRALRFSIDFSVPQLNWTFYNFKLFHWQIWDDRVETQMNYSHPNTYTITVDLTAGYDSKFISPWDFDLGSDNPSALSGNLINGGGSNLVNITTDGTYTVTIILANDYQTGTYEFAP